MFAKKTRIAASAPKEFRKELEYLYARRTTVDSLIESLEHYDRFRSRTAAQPLKRKLA
jgi:hypothetical protein